MHILLVEDDNAIRDILEQVLISEGHQVDAAADGVEALSTLQRIDSPDLILVDQLMPRMNGTEFLARIRKDSRFEGTPVIMLSGLESVDPKGLFLKKPFTLDQLDEALKKCKAPRANVDAEGFAQFPMTACAATA